MLLRRDVLSHCGTLLRITLLLALLMSRCLCLRVSACVCVSACVWCSWYDVNNLDLVKITDDYVSRSIPLDVFVIDMDWHTKDNWCVVFLGSHCSRVPIGTPVVVPCCRNGLRALFFVCWCLFGTQVGLHVRLTSVPVPHRFYGLPARAGPAW